jgi:nucleoside-diphosphate-sugar epimerase
MRILLTGASGFIGSHTARILLEQGHDLYTVIRPEDDTWRIADILSDLHVITADIADFDLPAYLQPEICIHLAWYGEHGAYWKSTKNFDMLSASLALAVRLSEIGCSRFVGIGTCVEYRIDQGYFSETSSILKPNHHTRPVS